MIAIGLYFIFGCFFALNSTHGVSFMLTLITMGNSKQYEEDDVLINEVNEQKKDPSAHLVVIEQDVAEGLNTI